MRDRPILFSGSMIRAILDGRKSQTRRVVKWSAVLSQSDGRKRRVFGPDDVPEMNDLLRHRQESPLRRMCPYGEVGGKLWVRETWAKAPPCVSMKPNVAYRADYHPPLSDFPPGGALPDGERRWRPSIHMPRWASRITLEITDVRVERLREISEADAMAEGIGRYDNGTFGLNDPGACMGTTAVVAYMRLWESIHGAGSWDANPLVWALTFRRIGDVAS